jgi:hypothetical protein
LRDLNLEVGIGGTGCGSGNSPPYSGVVIRGGETAESGWPTEVSVITAETEEREVLFGRSIERFVRPASRIGATNQRSKVFARRLGV